MRIYNLHFNMMIQYSKVALNELLRIIYILHSKARNFMGLQKNVITKYRLNGSKSF